MGIKLQGYIIKLHYKKTYYIIKKIVKKLFDLKYNMSLFLNITWEVALN